MAINETTFTTVSIPDTVALIESTGVFDRVEANNTTIECYIDGVDSSVFNISFYGSTNADCSGFNLYNYSGASVAEFTGSFTKIITTSKGFGLYSASENKYVGFITKSDNGLPMCTYSNGTSLKSVSTNSLLSYPDVNSFPALRQSSEKVTVLTPMLSYSCGEITRGLYIIMSTQITQAGRIRIGSTVVYSNGYVALAD